MAQLDALRAKLTECDAAQKGTYDSMAATVGVAQKASQDAITTLGEGQVQEKQNNSVDKALEQVAKAQEQGDALEIVLADAVHNSNLIKEQVGIMDSRRRSCTEYYSRMKAWCYSCITEIKYFSFGCGAGVLFAFIVFVLISLHIL